MKTSSTAALLSLMGVLAIFGSRRGFAKPGNTATSNSNPFSDIAERNVFGLRPPPTNDLAHAGPPKAPVNIKISGFVKHATQGTRVLLATVPKDPKQQMKFYNLGVGEKEDGVQLVKIHPGQDAVDVVIDGVPEELTVKSNSFLTGIYGKNTVQQRPGPAAGLYGRNVVQRPGPIPVPVRRWGGR
jgi:hypothetical protein